ncbi:MAG: beta-ketoacyl-[Desulfovibrionaceae bacterium]|nr:beta-ketoacyl-[acyl-carrier-protein] synthase II [Desulfovibrionaceae bacterium]
MHKKRVVVTGLSALTPLGNTLGESWDNLLAGKSGIGPITRFDVSDYAARIAGEIKNFNPEPYINPKEVRRMDIFTQYGVAAGKMLLEHAGF